MKANILLIGCIMASLVPGISQTNPPAASGPRIAFAGVEYDFGRVAAGALVDHDYVFTNIGDQELLISDVQPSCGCTSAGAWDRSVGPGQTGKIPVRFNSAGFADQVQKSVLVTCNDPAQPTVALTLVGAIRKIFDISPHFVVFDFPPEAQSNQTRAVRIAYNGDQSAVVSDPACGNAAFELALKTVKEGQEYELNITALAAHLPGTVSSPVTLKTSVKESPTLSVVAVAMRQPFFSLRPAQITLPAAPLAHATEITVNIQNNGANPAVLSKPEINAPGASVKLMEREPGKQFTLSLDLPAGFSCPAGGQVTVKSDNPRYPLITIPVNQPAGAP